MSHTVWVILTIVIRSKMAVNGARVSSFNKTARSAIDTANLKWRRMFIFLAYTQYFEYNSTLVNPFNPLLTVFRFYSDEKPAEQPIADLVWLPVISQQVAILEKFYSTHLLWNDNLSPFWSKLPDLTDSCEPQLVPSMNSRPSQRSVLLALSIGGTLQTFESGDWNFWTWFFTVWEFMSG